MDIPVLLEPTPTGFRATSGAPFNLTAEAATADAAILELRKQWAVRLALSEVRAVSVALPEPDPMFEHARRLGASPLFEEWAASVKEARRLRDAEEEAADAAKQAELDRLAEQNGHPAPNPTATEPVA